MLVREREKTERRERVITCVPEIKSGKGKSEPKGKVSQTQQNKASASEACEWRWNERRAFSPSSLLLPHSLPPLFDTHRHKRTPMPESRKRRLIQDEEDEVEDHPVVPERSVKQAKTDNRQQANGNGKVIA